MRNFVRKALDKIDKLDSFQVKKLLMDISSENELMEMVLDSMTDGVIVLDEEHKILAVNKSSKRLLPFTPGEAGEKLIWTVIADEEIGAFIKNALQSHEKVSDMEFTLENGSRRTISVSLMYLVNAGAIRGNLIHIEDITEKKTKETRLRRAESLASLTTLTAGVAHEIKNPLGSIGIHLQLIQKNIENQNIPHSEDLTKYVNIIKEEVNRLNKVVVDFLFAVHPIDTEFEVRDLNSLMEELLDFLQYELEEAGVRVVAQLKDIPDIEMDSKYIKQALLNIIKNSIAAMPEGGTLSVRTQRVKDQVELKISDTGCGIPHENMNKIFEPYFTTKDFGSGLGLTIVFKVIKEHMGDINVISRENEGTEFILTFPIPQKEKHLLNFEGDNT